MNPDSIDSIDGNDSSNSIDNIENFDNIDSSDSSDSNDSINSVNSSDSNDKYISRQVQKHTSKQEKDYTGTLTYTNIHIHKYTSTQVHR